MARGHEQRSADMATEQEKQMAKELAARSATQAKHSAKNTGRAAKAAAPVVAEKVGDMAEKVNDAAEGAEQAAEELTSKAVRTGIKFIPSTRFKLFTSAAVTGLGLCLTLRYFAIDAVERYATQNTAE